MYRTGTVTVTSGSKQVIGNDTFWTNVDSINAGYLFTIDGQKFYEIVDVLSDNELRIENIISGAGYEESTSTNINYAIVLPFGVNISAAIAKNTLELQKKWQQTQRDQLKWMNSTEPTAEITSYTGELIEVITPSEITRLVQAGFFPSDSAWLTGNGSPDDAIGSEGSMYINIANQGVYRKENGSWVMLFTIAGGSGSIAVQLSRDSIVVVTDDQGDGGDYTNANCTVRVLVGQFDDTVNWSISATESVGVTGTLSGNEYVITGLSEDAGSVVFTAARDNYPDISKALSITKIPIGGPIEDSRLPESVLGAIELSELNSQTLSTQEGVVSQLGIDLNDAISSFNTTTGDIQSDLTSLESSLGDVNSLLGTSYYTIAQVDGAISSSEATLQSQIDSSNSNISNNYYTIAQTDSAISSVNLNLQSQIDTSNSNISNNYYTQSQTDSAISGQVNNLRSEIFTPSGDLATSFITQIDTATSNADEVEAIATSLSNLEAEIDHPSTGLDATRAQLTTTNQALVDETQARTTAISTLNSNIRTDLGQDISAVSTQAQNAQTTADGAVSAISTLETEVNSATGTANSALALASSNEGDINSLQSSVDSSVAALTSSVQGAQSTADGAVVLANTVQETVNNIDKNLINSSNQWVVGTTGSQGIFNGRGGSEGVALEVGPSGATEPVWISENGNNEGLKGWITSGFSIDHNKTYRYSVWMRRSGLDVTLYLGCKQRDTLNLSGAISVNPYFWAGDLPELNKWFLVVGLLHGSAYSGGYSGVSGVYDPDTGDRVIVGSDFKLPTYATIQIQRTYRSHSINPSHTARFARPRVDEVNGEEPSLVELMSFDIVPNLVSEVSTLSESLVTVSSTATNAKSTADSANGTAIDGRDRAISAQSTASSALSLANTVEGNLNTLDGEVNTLSTSLASVTSTANSANNTANSALSLANTASSDIDNLESQASLVASTTSEGRTRVAGMKANSTATTTKLDFIGDSVRFLRDDGSTAISYDTVNDAYLFDGRGQFNDGLYSFNSSAFLEVGRDRITKAAYNGVELGVISGPLVDNVIRINQTSILIQTIEAPITLSAPDIRLFGNVEVSGFLDVGQDLSVNGVIYNFTGGHPALNTDDFEYGDVIEEYNVTILNPNNSIGDSRLTTTPNSKTVLGTFAGRRDDDTILTQSVGEGVIKVCGEAGDLSAGDLVVSSNTTGVAMKQSDDVVRSYTIAKVRKSHEFSSPTETVTLPCILMCG